MDKTGIPLPNAAIRKSLEDVEVFEEGSQVPQSSMILTSGSAKKLSIVSLHALVRMFYEAHGLGSNYVLQDTQEGFFKVSPVLLNANQPQNTAADQVLEAIRFKPLDQGVEIDRTVMEDGVCVQEQARVIASQVLINLECWFA